jgi:hypothetical protein
MAFGCDGDGGDGDGPTAYRFSELFGARRARRGNL